MIFELQTFHWLPAAYHALEAWSSCDNNYYIFSSMRILIICWFVLIRVQYYMLNFQTILFLVTQPLSSCISSIHHLSDTLFYLLFAQLVICLSSQYNLQCQSLIVDSKCPISMFVTSFSMFNVHGSEFYSESISSSLQVYKHGM